MVAKRNIDKRATDVLKAWLLSEEHFAHPYPTIQERHELAAKAGIDPKQVLNWFVNARKRIWQPLLMEMGEDVKKYLSTGRCCSAAKRKAVEIEKQLMKKPRLVPPPSIVTTAGPSHLPSCERPDIAELLDRCDAKSESDSEPVSSPCSHSSSGESSDSGSRSPSPTSSTGTRKGQWTEEEENYAHKLIWAFEKGFLQLDEGVTLRAFLAKKLNCPPMRISKKFVGAEKIGKLLYTPKSADPALLAQVEDELRFLENAFLASISQDSVFRTASTHMKLAAANRSGPSMQPSVNISSFSRNMKVEPTALSHAVNSEAFHLPRTSSLQEILPLLDMDQSILDMIGEGLDMDGLFMENAGPSMNDTSFLFDDNITFVDSLPQSGPLTVPTSHLQAPHSQPQQFSVHPQGLSLVGGNDILWC